MGLTSAERPQRATQRRRRRKAAENTPSLHDALPIYEQRSNAERKRGDGIGEGGTDDHDATCQPDGDRRTDGELRSNGEWDCAAELPVAEEWGQHQRSDLRELHNAGDG